MDGSAAFDAIAQEQSKKASLPNKTADDTYTINTSDGNISKYIDRYYIKRKDLRITHCCITL